MAELFLNPWSMLAGALLVGVPVVVHLINRLRYRRVRFAAMEFLLKAQKRVRRKLLIQQLLLLLLRCLLVLLLGLLAARFLGFDLSGREGRPTHHVVVLDDTPSMADGWKGDDGTATDAFEQAKRVLSRDIAPAAAEATAAQTLEVVRLSDLTASRPFGRLTPDSVRELGTYLQPLRPGLVRVTLAEGLTKAKELLAAQPADSNRLVHVLSDLRAVDFSDETEAVKAVVGEMTVGGTNVFLIDVAHPARKPTERRAPAAHDNLAVTDLSPARPAVGRFEPVEFTLRVHNFGAAELTDVRFAVRVNGDENKGRSVVFPSVPGNQERAVKFELTFDQLGTPEKPLDRFSLVTASLETGEPGGLAVDNVRHAVVEVKERLPILVVDGRPNLRDAREGDSFFLRPVFTSVLGGYGWQDGTARDLEQLDLSKFAFVLLLNVPTLTEPAVKALETYCRDGGGVGFWLGPDVNAGKYDELLYRDGAGLFPVPLAAAPSPEIPEEELLRRRYQISQKKFLVRDPAKRAHPVLAGLYLDERGLPASDVDKLERVFGFVTVRRHWPVPTLGRWREDKAVAELYCLPNDGKTADNERAVRGLVDAIPLDVAEYAAYREVLKPIRDELKRIGDVGEPLYQLANQLDDFLADSTDGPTTAKLREFWANPKTTALRADAVRLRDKVKFGDPFLLAKQFGRGRVTLVTTTAGDSWTDWPSEPPGSASFAPIIKELGGYLSGGGVPESRPVGKVVELRFPADRFRPVVGRAALSHDPTAKPQPGQPLVTRTDLKEQPLVAEGGDLVLRFGEAVQPGAYLFTATGVKPGADGNPVAEYRAVAVNVDTRESDLRRAAGDDLAVLAPKAKVVAANDSGWLAELRDRRADLSEGVWLILLLAAMLAAEQWLSVRLSFHHAGGTATA